jgi:hypothetical protein
MPATENKFPTRAQHAAGILGEDVTTGETILTDNAVNKFNNMVKELLFAGMPEINVSTMFCFNFPGFKYANLLDLSDRNKYPAYYKYILGTYLEVAKALDLEGDFKFFPAIFDPFAFGLKLNIDFEIPPITIPDLPQLALDLAPKFELKKPEIVAKLPDLGLQFPPPVPPQIPLPNIKLPEIPSFAIDLKAWFDILINLPDIFVKFAGTIPDIIFSFPNIDLCATFAKLLPPALKLDDPNAVKPALLAAGATVLVKAIAECVVFAAIGVTLGVSRSGFVGMAATHFGYLPSSAGQTTGTGEQPTGGAAQTTGVESQTQGTTEGGTSGETQGAGTSGTGTTGGGATTNATDKYKGKTLIAVPGLRENTSPDFRKRLFDVAAELAPNNADNMADWMVTCMSLESAKTFSPQVRPAGTSKKDKFAAVGLFQFIGSTYGVLNKKLGTNYSFDSVYAMSAIEQLDVCRDFLKVVAMNYNKSPEKLYKKLEDVYLAIFASNFVGKPLGAIAYSQSTQTEKGKEYDNNEKLDKNKDGNITVGEVSGAIRGVWNGAKNKRIDIEGNIVG